MARLRLFASAAEAAGRSHDEVPGHTVAAILAEAQRRYGAAFANVLGTCQIWLNGDPVASSDPVGDNDEVAVVPPLSGG